MCEKNSTRFLKTHICKPRTLREQDTRLQTDNATVVILQVVMLGVSPLNRFSAVHLLSSSLSLAAITAPHTFCSPHAVTRTGFCQTPSVACICGALQRDHHYSTSGLFLQSKLRERRTIKHKQSTGGVQTSAKGTIKK